MKLLIRIIPGLSVTFLLNKKSVRISNIMYLSIGENNDSKKLQ